MTTKTPTLIDLQREAAGIAGKIQDAANADDIAALTALRARGDALPLAIRAAERREADRAVLEAEAAIAEAEQAREAAYAALESANERLESAKRERTRLAGEAEDAREAVKEARRRHRQAQEAADAWRAPLAS